MQDSQIVEMYWAREEAAIRETQTKYEPYLMKIAQNILSDFEDSRESVNDTYLAAWNSIPPHRPSVLSTYLGKITRRISIDIYRKRFRHKRLGSEYALSLSELGECIADTDSPEQEYELKRLTKAINEFLRKLPEEARNTFIGRYYFLDSVHEVAGYCGMSEAKAKSLLYRTRRSLKAFLTEEGFDI